MATDAPPPYVRTVYDETLRSKFYMSPFIGSMANRPNLIGQLEHHSPNTDGSFSICIASGQGVFISQALLESIPAEHRPTLDTTHKPEVETLVSGTMKSIGTTFFPLILTKRDNGEKIRIVLYAIVLPDLFINMFIGGLGGGLVRTSIFGGGQAHFGFGFGQGDDDVTWVRGF